MRKYLLQIVCLAVLCTTIYSCKLDAPILPGDPNYVAVTPPDGGDGGTGGGITTPIDNASLTGTWKVDVSKSIVYSDGVPTESQVTLFTDAEFDDVAKTVIFHGQFTLPSDETSYVLSTSNGKTYLQFAADVFQRSTNAPVEITSFDGTTMTWRAVDPLILTSGGHKIQSAWEE